MDRVDWRINYIMHEKDEKKRLALFGACCSRDAFNSQFIPEWRNEFILELYRFQPSIISIMSQPIAYEREDMGRLEDRNFWQNMLLNEMEKSYMEELVASEPDIILLDFYSDVLNGVIEVGNSYITNRKCNWGGDRVFCGLDKGGSIKPIESHEKYMALWKSCYDRFAGLISKQLPNAQVIVNSCRFSDVYEKDGEVRTYLHSSKLSIGRMNDIWEEMDDYAEKMEAARIRYEHGYMLDPDYIYGGLWYVHFEKQYFRDYFDKLKSMTTVLPLNGKAQTDVRYNMLCNGSFVYGTRFYRYWDKLYRVEGNRCIFSNHFNANARCPQIWSNLMVNPAGKHRYVFSLLCRVKESELMDGNMVAAIRTYDKRNAMTYKDSTKEYKIYLSEEEKKIKGWQRIEYEFEVESKYFACGLAVVCRGELEFRDLACYRQDGYEYIFRDSKSLIERNLMQCV